MVKFAQNFRYGYYDMPPKERMRLIKEAGFEGIMMWWGDHFVNTDGDKEDIVKYAKEYGLFISNLHTPSKEANRIWYGGDEGKAQVEMYKNVVLAAERVKAPSIIVHLTCGATPAKICEQGLENLYEVVKLAEKCGVYLAFENTRFLEYNQFVYDNIKSDVVKLCFDSGHNNCYTPTADVLGLFGDKLITTHLHDNYGRKEGECDLHHLIGDGNINFDAVFTKLKSLTPCVYNLESACNPTSKYKNLSAAEFLKLSHAKISSFFK